MTPKQDANFLFNYAKKTLWFNYTEAKRFCYLYVRAKLHKLKTKKSIKHWETVKQEIEKL